MVPQLSKILYASDLSANSAPALAWAMTLAERHDARITLLHVIEEASPSMSYNIRSFMGEEKWMEMVAGQQTEGNAQARVRIQEFCDGVQKDMPACPLAVDEIVIKRGIPVEEILEEAESRGSELIIMGTHGYGLFKNAMIGSNARRVVRRSRIPVLVIPLPDRKDD